MISLIVAAAMLISGSDSSGPGQASLAARKPADTLPAAVSDQAAAHSARDWVALVDGKNWQQSWDNSGRLFQSQITPERWAATIEPVRKPLGAVVSRELGKVTRTRSLPGAPDGEYQIIEFATSFANKSEAIETVALAHENSGWKVVGYFIR